MVMKIIPRLLAVAVVVPLLIASDSAGSTVDHITARTIATNWIQSVINFKDSWGGSPGAQVAEVTEFKRGERVLGHYCTVEPSGYVLVSLVEGLAPVKAYSETSGLDIDTDDGMVDVLKYKMGQLLDIVEERVGPVKTATRAALSSIPELDRFDTWDMLKVGAVVSNKKYTAAPEGGNYQEGEILLTSRWHQGWPYYLQCPVPTPLGTCTNPHCAVGCVATAAAQIMRYWCWPPGRDWMNMPDQMNINPTQAEIDAVSELSHAIGVAVGMKYCDEGECGSGAPTSDMIPVYGAWSFGSPAQRNRPDYSLTEWWNFIVGDINDNSPVQYRILGHSIVCDGYWSYPDPILHMNYGWANDRDDWYVPDQLYQVKEDGGPDDEYILIRIGPWSSLDSWFSGDYAAWYPRYVSRDCWGDSVDFEVGTQLQFHNRKVMTCNSGWINFIGLPGQTTRLYCGDQTRGVRIDNGYILTYPGGAMRFAVSRLD